MREFSKTLNELNFKHIPQGNIKDAWCKRYNGFTLFIVKMPNGKMLASIKVGKVEVLLPFIPDEYWIVDFDKSNLDD